MALVTDKPDDIPTSNDLDHIDLGDIPPAYLSFGSTPNAMSEPPEVGEIRTYVVRVECTGQSESVRTDGEHRFGRKLSVLWAVQKGKTEPPDPDAEQPALFGEDGEIAVDEAEAEADESQADEDQGAELDGEECGRPPFSDEAD